MADFVRHFEYSFFSWKAINAKSDLDYVQEACKAETQMSGSFYPLPCSHLELIHLRVLMRQRNLWAEKDSENGKVILYWFSKVTKVKSEKPFCFLVQLLGSCCKVHQLHTHIKHMSAVFAISNFFLFLLGGLAFFSYYITNIVSVTISFRNIFLRASFCSCLNLFIVTETQFGRFMFCKLLPLHFHCKCGIKILQF